MSRMVSFLLLVGIIIAIGFLFYRVMIGFLLPLFLAALLVVIFRPLHRWFLAQLKGRPRLAAGLTTATVMVIVLVPMVVVLTMAAVEAGSLVRNFDGQEVKQKFSKLRQSLGLQMPIPAEREEDLHYLEASFEKLVQDTSGGATARIDEQVLVNLETVLKDLREMIENSRHEPFGKQAAEVERLVAAAGRAAPGSIQRQRFIRDAARAFDKLKTDLLGGEYLSGLVEFVNPASEDLERIKNRVFAGAPDLFRAIGGATGVFATRLIFGVLIMVISLYFFLRDGPAMVSSFMRLSPLEDRHEQELLEEFDRVSRAVVVATLLSAATQGILGGIGYWFAGVGSVFLLTVLTAVLALIPFVGAAAVWVPVCIYLFFFEERHVAATLLFIYGAAIVSMADNVIKPLVLHGQSNLHPLLALLSVLGGVQALGPIGVLVGPMVVVFLQTLLNILHRELTVLEK